MSLSNGISIFNTDLVTEPHKLPYSPLKSRRLIRRRWFVSLRRSSYMVFIIPNHLFRHLIDHSSSPCFPTDFDIPPWYSEELTTHHGEDSRFFNMGSITRLHLLRRREKSIQLAVRYMIGPNIYSTLSVCTM